MAEMVNEQREKFDEKDGLMDELKKWKTKFEKFEYFHIEASRAKLERRNIRTLLEGGQTGSRSTKIFSSTLQSAIESNISSINKQEAESKKWKTKFENLNTSISKQAEQSSIDAKALERSLKAAQEVEALKSSAATLQSTIESKDSLINKQEAESKHWKTKFEQY